MGKLIQIAVSAALLLFAAAVFADDGAAGTSSAYFHKADAGKFELMAGVGLDPQRTAWTAGEPTGVYNPNGFQFFTAKSRSGKNYNITNLPIAVAGEYGINSMFSLGASLIYGNAKLGCNGCTSITAKGLLNPSLYLKGQSATGPGAVIYGAVASLGIEKSKFDTSGNSNLATGGSSLTPYVGYQMMAGPGVWGGRLQYDIWKGDRKGTDDSIPGDTNTSGGNTWAVDTFFEMPAGSLTVGGSLYYLSSTDTKQSVNGGASTNDNNASNTIGIQFYSPLEMGGWTLLPHVDYSMITFTSDSYGTSSQDLIQIGVAARFTL